MTKSQEDSELKKSLFCGLNQAKPSEGPEMDGCLTLKDLQKKTSGITGSFLPHRTSVRQIMMKLSCWS